VSASSRTQVGNRGAQTGLKNRNDRELLIRPDPETKGGDQVEVNRRHSTNIRGRETTTRKTILRVMAVTTSPPDSVVSQKCDRGASRGEQAK